MNAVAKLACTLLCAAATTELAAGQNIGVEYCTSNPNTTGQAAKLEVFGVPDTQGINMVLVGSQTPVNTPFIFIYGPNAASTPLSAGTLCISPANGGITRILPPQMTDLNGYAYYWVTGADLGGPFGGTPQAPTMNYQGWFRDPISGATDSNLTSAVRVTFIPCLNCK